MNRQKVGIEELAERLLSKGYVYIDNYTGCDGTVDVICCKCGQRKTINMITFRHQKFMYCRECENKEKKIRQEERRRLRETEREMRKQQLKLENEERRKREKVLREQERAEAFRKEREAVKVVCKECGKVFSHADRMSNSYCSVKCSKKHNNRIKSRQRDARKRGNGKSESIDLIKLYKRDKGYCYLCNGLCDLEDYEYRENTFIAGNDYPSIDHVIPLSIGGEDTWENVKLAHRSCNSRKGARKAI